MANNTKRLLKTLAKMQLDFKYKKCDYLNMYKLIKLRNNWFNSIGNKYYIQYCILCLIY